MHLPPRRLSRVGLGLVALLACSQSPSTPSQGTTRKQNSIANPSAFLDIQSYTEGEALLRRYIGEGREEVAWMTDGVLWRNIGGISTKHSNQIDDDALDEALSTALHSTLYFYHQHSLMRVNERRVLNVPSVADLISTILLNRHAARYERRVISRVVEVHGTWEFMVEDKPGILPPHADIMLEVLMPTGASIQHTPRQTLDLQIKYRHLEPVQQAPYFLSMYDTIEGVSMQFVAGEVPYHSPQ